jgi:hypothetical protein
MSDDINYETPLEVAERNGCVIDMRFGYEPKWLYILFWPELQMVKVGLTKHKYINRDDNIRQRIRCICRDENLNFPEIVFSTGGTSRHEHGIREQLKEFQIHNRKDWFHLDRKSKRIINKILQFFDEHDFSNQFPRLLD